MFQVGHVLLLPQIVGIPTSGYSDSPVPGMDSEFLTSPQSGDMWPVRTSTPRIFTYRLIDSNSSSRYSCCRCEHVGIDINPGFHDPVRTIGKQLGLQCAASTSLNL